MGCSASANTPPPKPSAIEEETIPDEKEKYLKVFRLVWFDSETSSAENKEYLKNFNKHFGECNYCTTLVDVIKAIKESKLITVVLSCGTEYETVKKVVEESSEVSAIYIVCKDAALREQYQSQCEKVIGSCKSLEEFKRDLKRVQHQYARIVRFVERKQRQAFYASKDINLLDEKVKRVFVDVGWRRNSAMSYDSFFPIDFEAVDLPLLISIDAGTSLLTTAFAYQSLSPYVPTIGGAMERLKDSGTKEEVIRTFTTDGIYNEFNKTIRHGYYQGLISLSEYIYCLKGSLMLLAEPITSKTTTFRGMVLDQDYLKLWKDEVGNLAVFSSFISTSLSKEKVLDFMKATKKPGKTLGLIEITFTDEIEEFNELISKLTFNEKRGVFYPTDISKYSVHPEEQEVLLPVFYPFKIAGVREEGDLCRIMLTAPTHVCVSTCVEYWDDYRMFDNVWEGSKEAKLKKECELVKRGLSDDLLFCIFSANYLTIDNKGFFGSPLFPLLLDTLCSTNPIRRFGLQDENEEDVTTDKLISVLQKLAEHQAENLKHLSFHAAAVSELAKCLPRFKNLTMLNLQCCNIKAERLVILAPSLKELKSLVMVNLGFNGLEAKDVTTLASIIVELKQLTKLDISGNGLKDEGLIALSPAIKELSLLASLNVESNEITQKGGEMLLSVVKNLKSLRVINLRNNDIPTEVYKEITSCAASH